MDEIIGTFGADILFGDSQNNIINGNSGNDILFGGAGNDRINGGSGDDGLVGGGVEGDLDAIYSVGGRDTLSGGLGNDAYFVSLTRGGGSEIRNSNSTADFLSEDALFIAAPNTDLETIANANPSNLDVFNTIIFDPNTWGDSAIELSLPQPGTVGLQRSQTDLIVDINRDGNAQAQNDLTVVDFFDEQGQQGDGYVDFINNIESQSIIDFFEDREAELIESLGEFTPGTVYRFLNSDTGVHFYTANEIERDTVALLNNYTFEDASYQSVDPLTGAEDSVPVYRFLNRDTGVHLYTVSEVERDATEDLANFSFEGEAFFAYATEVDGSIPIYRFLNSTTGAHFYTPSAIERDAVLELPDYQSEGIAYYALPVSEDV